MTQLPEWERWFVKSLNAELETAGRDEWTLDRWRAFFISHASVYQNFNRQLCGLYAYARGRGLEPPAGYLALATRLPKATSAYENEVLAEVALSVLRATCPQCGEEMDQTPSGWEVCLSCDSKLYAAFAD